MEAAQTGRSDRDYWARHCDQWSSKVVAADPETSKELYNIWALTFDDDYLFEHYGCALPSFVASELDRLYEGRSKDSCKILDLACGTGRNAQKLVEHGYTHIDGIDASPGMLAVARQKGIYTHLTEALVTAAGMPYDNDVYDAVVGTSCFLPGHIMPDCFDEFIRILKPGGHLVTAIRGKYMRHYESDIQRLHDEGKWKWLVKRSVDNAHVHGPAFLVVTQIC